ncbi:MAG: adenosylcobinamide-GDP ribazoletransferase [Oscillospiraceae bacterium]|nr:adenosylcobinamide-GDP ribazoletransferase [Oscillospiraceae bacterium]
MKTYFHAFAMCQSMFCAIPFPGNIWDEKARDRMLLFLPVVGLEIGLIWAGLAWLCDLLELPFLVKGLILSVYPYLVTGFIHLDGFMDVTDAVKSCRSLERRREILKDSHVGAFAVIGIVLLLLAQFACMASAKETASYLILAFVPAVSRCCSALAVTVLKPMSTSQYADQRKPKSHIGLLTAMTALFVAAGFWCCGRYGFVLLGCLAGYGAALRKGYKSLEGMNGDISGYALSIGELCAVAVYALL